MSERGRAEARRARREGASEGGGGTGERAGGRGPARASGRRRRRRRRRRGRRKPGSGGGGGGGGGGGAADTLPAPTLSSPAPPPAVDLGLGAPRRGPRCFLRADPGPAWPIKGCGPNLAGIANLGGGGRAGRREEGRGGEAGRPGGWQLQGHCLWAPGLAAFHRPPLCCPGTLRAASTACTRPGHRVSLATPRTRLGPPHFLLLPPRPTQPGAFARSSLSALHWRDAGPQGVQRLPVRPSVEGARTLPRAPAPAPAPLDTQASFQYVSLECTHL